MVTPFFNGAKLINSVNNKNRLVVPSCGIMINKDQDGKEVIETSRVSPSDEPNRMSYHRNKLLYSDEGNSKYYKYDHNKKISLVTLEKISLVNPEDNFLCHAQVIMTIRDQGRNWDLTYTGFPWIVIIISYVSIGTRYFLIRGVIRFLSLILTRFVNLILTSLSVLSTYSMTY